MRTTFHIFPIFAFSPSCLARRFSFAPFAAVFAFASRLVATFIVVLIAVYATPDQNERIKTTSNVYQLRRWSS
jgi:hypothetical protein